MRLLELHKKKKQLAKQLRRTPEKHEKTTERDPVREAIELEQENKMVWGASPEEIGYFFKWVTQNVRS